MPERALLRYLSGGDVPALSLRGVLACTRRLGDGRLYTFLLAPGRCRKPLCAIDARLGYAPETKLAAPFDQVRLKPGLEVPEDLLYRVPVHFPIRRKFL